MPFDPAKPANNAPLSSAEMRAQLTALNAAILLRALQADLIAVNSNSSANTNGVNTLALTVSDPPTQGEMQTLADKLDELINTLRR